MSDKFVKITFNNGDKIITEGDESDTFYILK